MSNPSEKRVLVVDDEPDVRNFLSACIEDAGFNVETAGSGEEALAKIEESLPDLMTIDMVMPGMSGVQLLRKLRKIKDCSGIPVIVITAHAKDEFGNEDIKKFRAFTSGQGPKHILEKPITPNSIVKAICDILKVDQDAMKKVSKKDEIKSMLNNCDSEMLEKIRQLIDK
jgi:CheY-like chemotaxis protein